MERLTKRDADGQAMMDCQKCEADWTGKHGRPMFDCTALYCRNRLKDRLAAYEDTGLTPERCAEFARADAEWITGDKMPNYPRIPYNSGKHYCSFCEMPAITYDSLGVYYGKVVFQEYLTPRCPYCGAHMKDGG